jgi:hypothetical protein
MVHNAQYDSRSIWIVSEDGLWDLCIGLLLFGIGITITINQLIWLVGIFVLAYFLVLMAGKETVTRPRMINFEIQETQLRKFTLTAVIDIFILILIMAISAMMFVKFDGVLTSGFLDEYAILILGVFAAILFIQFGILLTGGVRFFVYSGLVLFAFTMSYIQSVPVVPIIYSIGAIFTIIGLIYFVSFVLRYPRSGRQGDKKT